jgi:hypothetical protein
VYFGSFFRTNLSGLQDSSIVFDHLAVLALATIVIALSNTFLPAYSWWLLVHPVQDTLRLSQSIWVYAYTQIGKYLPGNVGHHVGRVFVASQLGMDRKVATWSVVTEALLLLVFATIQAVLILLLFSPAMDFPFGRWLSPTRLIAVLSLMTVSIFGAYFVVNRMNWRPVRQLIGEWRIPLPSFKTLGGYFLVNCVNALIMGCVLAYIGLELFSISLSHYWLMLCAWLFAWVIGFTFPGAPAGLGVREGIIAALLETSLGGTATLGLIVVHRLVTSLVDVLVFAIAFQQRHRFLPSTSD